MTLEEKIKYNRASALILVGRLNGSACISSNLISA